MGRLVLPYKFDSSNKRIADLLKSKRFLYERPNQNASPVKDFNKTVCLFATPGLVRWRFRNLDSAPILQKNGRLRLTLCAVVSRAEVIFRFAIAFCCSSQWARSSTCNAILV